MVKQESLKVSLITATYNNSATIAGCIGSINNQTYKNVEHIIIDGASKDNTVGIIKSMANRVSQIVSEPDCGIYDALNKGIRLANGDIIGFLHADDELADPGTLACVISGFKDDDTSGVFGDLVYVDKGNINNILRYWKSRPFQSANLKYGWMPPHPTLFLRKEVYQKFGLFDLDYKIAADYEFILRILKDSKLLIEYIPSIITRMRTGGASNKSIKNIFRKSKEDYQAIRKYPLWGILTLLFKNAGKMTQFIWRY